MGNLLEICLWVASRVVGISQYLVALGEDIEAVLVEFEVRDLVCLHVHHLQS